MSAGARRNGLSVRPVEQHDLTQWLPLWWGYCASYGRSNDPAPLDLATPPDAVTMTTWSRFLDASEPIHALVAERDGRLLGLAHIVYHRNTGTIGPVCYLQDLFTADSARGAGIGRALIEAVYAAAARDGAERVYWQTQHTNTVAMALYDKLGTQLAVHVYRKELVD
jgi:GNAT superfamily N-acetyltransferase